MRNHLLLTLFLGVSILLQSQTSVFTNYDLLKMKQVMETSISPDGQWIAYTINSKRPLEETPGSDYRELHIQKVNGESRPFISGKVRIIAPQWKSDNRTLTFLMNTGDGKGTQVYAIHTDGGSYYPLTSVSNYIQQYELSPAGDKIAYVALDKSVEPSKDLVKMGFNAEVFEEEILGRNLYVMDLPSGKPRQLNSGNAIFDFAWSPD